MSPQVIEINFAQMPDSQSMAMYKDKLIVYDNINVPLSETYTEEIKEFLGRFPLKIDFTIIVLCLKGGISVDCNLQHYDIVPGDIMVFVPGTIGEKVVLEPDSKLIVMSVSDNHYAPVGTLKKNLFAKANFVQPIKFGIEADMLSPAVQEYQHLKHAMLTYGENLTDELISAYIMVLTSFASASLAKWNDAHPLPDGSAGKLFRDFMELIGKHHIEHKDVAFYADACGLSPKYFAKQIYKASGKHPLDWIKASVILNAQAMLRSGQYSIAQICEALNFSSQSSFNRYFKSETGVSPTDYQKQ